MNKTSGSRSFPSAMKRLCYKKKKTTQSYYTSLGLLNKQPLPQSFVLYLFAD